MSLIIEAGWYDLLMSAIGRLLQGHLGEAHERDSNPPNKLHRYLPTPTVSGPLLNIPASAHIRN